MYLQKVISRKIFVLINFFDGILKVNNEKKDPDPDPDPDSLVRGIVTRTRIRFRTKMSWIHNTE